MDPLRITLILATLLCSLVAGFVFAFAVVAMPGIRNLDDRGFIQAFQVMDRVIQNNQPIFILVWLGSAVALVISAILGFWQLHGVERLLIVFATVVYLFGVQLPTASINVPLNNRLQTVDVETASEAALEEARAGFEQRWNRWNSIRTVFGVLTSVLLIVLLVRLPWLPS